MPRPRSLRSLTIATNARRGASPAPPSPTFSDTSHASVMNFGPNGPDKIITRANLKASLHAYEELLNTCANYRAALLNMSKATAAFADAMEQCSSLKGPDHEAGSRLMAASGLHHLMGNHWHVLAETLDKNFEKQLRQHLETYRRAVTERSASYEKALREKSHIIRQTELHGMNKKERNLQSFREALFVLQRQVDELDALKAQHYQEILEHEEEVWDVVQGKVCVVVRSTMDVLDRFTSKASDPIIEPMLQAVPDPFDCYGPPREEDQIFSILPPLSIMTNAPSSSSGSLASTPENEPVLELPPTISPWNPINGGCIQESNSQWAEVARPSSTSPPSISPPSTSRRHTPPVYSDPGIHQRKSESKLRSVLSIIDEPPSPQPLKEVFSPPGPAPLLVLNGNPPDPGDSWAGLRLEDAEDDSEEDNETGAETPRNLDLIIPQPIQSLAADTERSHHSLLDQVQAPSITLSC